MKFIWYSANAENQCNDTLQHQSQVWDAHAACQGAHSNLCSATFSVQTRDLSKGAKTSFSKGTKQELQSCNHKDLNIQCNVEHLLQVKLEYIYGPCQKILRDRKGDPSKNSGMCVCLSINRPFQQKSFY